MFCKYFIFSGTTNVFITIFIMCFISMIILSLNYNKDNNLNPYKIKLIYTPLVLIIFIFSGFSLDVFYIISFYILIFINFDLPFLYSTGNPGSSLPESSRGPSGMGGSSGVGGSGGNNNGLNLVSHIPNDEQVHGKKRSIKLKYMKVNEQYRLVKEYYNTGSKKEFLDAFSIAYDNLYRDPRSLDYNDLAVLKKGFVDYNYLLSLNSKEYLHGLAKPGKVSKHFGHGLRTGNLIDYRQTIAFDASRIKQQIEQEI